MRDLRPWLLLWRTPGVGPKLFAKALRQFGDPAVVLAARPAELENCGFGAKSREFLRSFDWSLIEPDLAWLSSGGQLVTILDPLYPPHLAAIDDPPPLLFVTGDAETLRQPQLAVVGSRNPTAGGRQTAMDFAQVLAGAGLGITSGLAEGIDAAAHEGALKSGGPGATIAVMGTGPDRLYPARHRELAQRIAQGGALVTEFPPGTSAKAEHFPRRNRIISGLSLGTLVVEAAMHSGSLITARHALEQGREVLAIPGSIHNPLARGCHALIRQGAKLVETAQDILEELAPLMKIPPGPVAAGSVATETSRDKDYARLLEALGYEPMAMDDLVARTGLSVAAISSMLLLLELEGHVSSVPGGRYSRIQTG